MPERLPVHPGTTTGITADGTTIGVATGRAGIRVTVGIGEAQ
jgi:hypothetical protein